MRVKLDIKKAVLNTEIGRPERAVNVSNLKEDLEFSVLRDGVSRQ